MERNHTIQLDAGKIDIQEGDNHITIKTTRLNTENISVILNTERPGDVDLGVSVNGQWLDGAYEAGRHES